MTYDFSNKVVFISGGGTGIGYAIARAFLQSSAQVILAGRRAEVLKHAASELRADLELPANCVSVKQADVGCAKQVQQLTCEIQDQFGHLDIVINNCGSWERCPVEAMSNTFMDKHISCNLKSVINGTVMAKTLLSSEGSIINMGSFSGILPMKQASLYSCLKSSVVSFTQSSAAELAEQGIRVNCVIPGVIRTEMTSDYIDAHYDKLIEPISLGRIGKPEDVASGVLFLCSDQATYITGTTLTISGGKFITQ